MAGLLPLKRLLHAGPPREEESGIVTTLLCGKSRESLKTGDENEGWDRLPDFMHALNGAPRRYEYEFCKGCLEAITPLVYLKYLEL